MRPDFDEVLRELNELIVEAQGLNRTNILMQIKLGLRYLRSYSSRILRAVRPLLAMCFFILFIIAVALLSFGVQQSGCVCIIVGSGGLYVTGMSFIRGKTRPRTASTSLVGLELSPGAMTHMQAPNSTDSATHIPRALGAKSIAGAKSIPAFNPLSPHSHSGDESEDTTAGIDLETGGNSSSATARSTLRNRAAVAMGVKVDGANPAAARRPLTTVNSSEIITI
jgi:hypothetical protein